MLTFAPSHGQMCGHGTYTINFLPKGEVAFELFSLIPNNKPYDSQELAAWISKTLPREDSGQESCCYLRQIKGKSAEKFLKNYKPENFHEVRKELSS